MLYTGAATDSFSTATACAQRQHLSYGWHGYQHLLHNDKLKLKKSHAIFLILKSFIYPQSFLTFDRMRNKQKKNKLPPPALEPPTKPSPQLSVQPCWHPSNFSPFFCPSVFYKPRLGSPPLSQRRASEIQRVTDFWRLLQCVFWCVLRADRKTDTASAWLSLLVPVVFIFLMHSSLSLWCHCLSGD